MTCSLNGSLNVFHMASHLIQLISIYIEDCGKHSEGRKQWQMTVCSAMLLQCHIPIKVMLFMCVYVTYV